MKGSGYVVAEGSSFHVKEGKAIRQLLPGDELPQGAYAEEVMKKFLSKGQIARKTVQAPLPKGAVDLGEPEVEKPRKLVTSKEPAKGAKKPGKILAAEGGE